MLPILDPSFGNLTSDPIVHCLPSKQDIMCKTSFGDGVHWTQECCCGKGKYVSKKTGSDICCCEWGSSGGMYAEPQQPEELSCGDGCCCSQFLCPAHCRGVITVDFH
eukprot:10050410-Ditylum_brightwellii.AAC.1